MTDIGKRIKERREALGISQEELAQKLGYKSKSTIAKIETGVNDIVQSKVIEFANALDTTVAYLMGWNNKSSKDTTSSEANYYLDDDTASLVQELYENKERRILLDAVRDISPEDLKTITNLVLSLKKKRDDTV